MEFKHNKDMLIEEIKLNSALNNRTIYLSEDIEDDICFKVNYFLDRIKKLDDESDIPYEDREHIKLIISSFGGSIYEALSVVSRIEYFKELGYIIETMVDAKSMSCGSLISQCGSKGYRTANRYSTILYHQASSGTYGTLSEMKCKMEEIERLWNLLKQITIKNTNITDEMMNELTKSNQDCYLNPIEALELGVIDKIL